MANSSASDWDEGSPLITSPRREGAGEILNLRKAVRQRLNKEHEAFVTGSSGDGGEHKEGSAVCYYQATAPTLRPDGTTSLGAADDGRIWVDSDTEAVYVWNGSAWVGMTTVAGSSITNFETTVSQSSLVLPSKTSLTNAHVYMITVYGTSIQSGSSFTISVTLGEGANAVTRTIEVSDGSSASLPFSITVPVTVSNSRIRVESSSNVRTFCAMIGVRVS